MRLIEKLFSQYLSEMDLSGNLNHHILSGMALASEKEFREMLSPEQTEKFEELFETTSQIHFIEVRDAFFSGCRIGADAGREFSI